MPLLKTEKIKTEKMNSPNQAFFFCLKFFCLCFFGFQVIQEKPRQELDELSDMLCCASYIRPARDQIAKCTEDLAHLGRLVRKLFDWVHRMHDGSTVDFKHY